MAVQPVELTEILVKFADSEWDLIDAPATAWLAANAAGTVDVALTAALVAAIEQADEECGSCGCEFDPLYKRALELLAF